MNWLKQFFQPKKTCAYETAGLAKERLKVIVAHERIQRTGSDFLPLLQKEITAVIAKYVDVGPEEVRVDFEHHGDRSVLELNITLPENFMSHAKAKSL